MNNTKKLLSAFLSIAMILFCMGCNAAENAADSTTDTITVTIDGSALIFDANPYITNGRTMVPMRAIFEALGCEVTWNNDEKSVTAVSDSTTVKLTIGETEMYVNNTAVALDQAAEITSDRTFVPVRAVSEALGCDVNWNNDTKTVEITSATTATITPENIASAINEAGRFAWDWFWDNKYTDHNDVIGAQYDSSENMWYGGYERVIKEGVTTLDDVRRLALPYFTSDTVERMINCKEWIEEDDALYVSATEGLGGIFPERFLASIRKISDSEYSITMCGYDDEFGELNYDTIESFNCINVNGTWVFDTTLCFPYDVSISVISNEAWKDTYIRYIYGLETATSYWGQYAYSLIYVDDDDIPELYVRGLSAAEGDRICTVGADGSVVECSLNRIGGASYIERSGMICNFNGNMDYYPLDFYRLNNGTFTNLEDAYGLEVVEWDKNGNDTEVYSWCGTVVTKNEFYANWNAVMNADDRISLGEVTYSATEIIELFFNK